MGLYVPVYLFHTGNRRPTRKNSPSNLSRRPIANLACQTGTKKKKKTDNNGNKAKSEQQSKQLKIFRKTQAL